jgi:membrane protein YdbS with pleckstrin-like domain
MYNAFRQLCERLLRIPHDPTAPPGHEADTRLFRAAPNFYRYLVLLWALKTAGVLLITLGPLAVPLVAAAIALGSQGKRGGWFLLLIPGFILVLAVVARLFALAVVRLDFEKRWYLVTDRSLRIREGVINVREMTVNFANIQNLSISQGPVQRLLGIADLQVETAGGGGAVRQEQATQNLHLAKFRGVNNANEVRELIQDRLRRLKDSGLGDPEEATALRPTSPAMLPATPEIRTLLTEILSESTALRRSLEHVYGRGRRPFQDSLGLRGTLAKDSKFPLHGSK